MFLAVIVTFNPSAVPKALGTTLTSQCRVLVVDNSTNPDSIKQLQDWVCLHNFDYIAMGGNVGIASAQNAGLEFARGINASGLIFFDQDSLIDACAIQVLVDTVSHGERAVYCLSPGTYGFPTYTRTFEMRELMSSGSGCRLDIFDTVGPFEAELFIDCVDFEWGWRCRLHGVPIFALQVGEFLHKLGKSKISVLGFSAHIDSPVRLYYQYRNITQMMFRNYVPLAWKCSQILLSSAKIVLIIILAKPRILRLKLAALGIVDGVRGNLGPYVDGSRR